MSKLSRRRFLQLMATGTVAVGCSPIIDSQLQKPLAASVMTSPQKDRIIHLLKRVTWGVTPKLITELSETGIEAWIAAQLDPDSVEDREMQLRLRRFDTLNLTAPDLLGFNRDRHYVADELAAATVTRAVFSRRQVYEMLVYFWTNHFNIYHFKDNTALLKTVDDREVIRPHALGNFGDMLLESAHSPAMLFYLDNILNEKSHPNENYAREIMELHTLGVDGSYTETDVLEVARCFTGWTITDRGEFEFRAGWHDEGEKTVLGHTISADGGKADGDRVLEILIDHPETAQYISYKLAQRFVADEPSTTVVNDLAKEWRDTGGNIQSVMRRLLSHDEFWSAPVKFKTPLEYALSALRVLNATYSGQSPLLERLTTLGQRPFNYSTPDGYPDVSAEWQGSLTQRWNFALDIVNGNIEGTGVPIAHWWDASQQSEDALAQGIWMRSASEQEQTVLNNATGSPLDNQDDLRQRLALLLSSPAFQWR